MNLAYLQGAHYPWLPRGDPQGNKYPDSGWQQTHQWFPASNYLSSKPDVITKETPQCFSSMPLDVCLLNTRGSNKGDEIVEFVTDNDLDILAMTETWLKPEHDIARGV